MLWHFNRHLIGLNIEQMTVITGIPCINAPTVHWETVHTNGGLTCIFAFVYPNSVWNGWE